MLAVIAFINYYNHLTVTCIQISSLSCSILIISMVVFLCVYKFQALICIKFINMSLIVYSFYILYGRRNTEKLAEVYNTHKVIMMNFYIFL